MKNEFTVEESNLISIYTEEGTASGLGSRAKVIKSISDAMEHLEDIDTVVIDIHRFIPFEGHFMEVMTDQHTTLFIDWKVKPKDIGKKGAMGTVTHGSVQAIDVNTRFQRVNGEQNLDLSVYKMVTENVYYTQIKGKLRSFRNIHSLLKLYSKDKQQLIKEFIETEKIKIENPKDILKVLKRFQ